MTANEMLAQAVLSSKELLTRYLAGFMDENRTKQVPGLPNHAVWSLGHCALTMHRAAERIDGSPPPSSDFTTGDAPDAFNPESVAFNSTPVDDPSRYPMLARGRAIYEAACDRLAQTVRDADDATLDRMTPWGASEISLRLLVARVVFHNGTHAGQITDLRRAIGMDRIL